MLTGSVMAFVELVPVDGDLVPELMKRYAYLWPLVIGAASILQRVVLVIGDYVDDGTINESFKARAQVVTTTTTTTSSPTDLTKPVIPEKAVRPDIPATKKETQST